MVPADVSYVTGENLMSGGPFLFCPEENLMSGGPFLFHNRLKDLPEDEPYYRCYITNGRKNIGYLNCRRIGLSESQGSATVSSLAENESVTLSRHFGISYILGYIGSDKRLDVILRNADKISLLKRMARVSGSDCYVIQAQTKCGMYALWLDPKHGYNAAKVRRSAKEGDYTHSRQMSKGETAKTYMSNIRFKKIGDIWVPMEAKAGCDRRMASGDFVKEDYHYKRANVILNPDHDKLGSFEVPIFENAANDPELIDGTKVEIQFALNNVMEYIWQDSVLLDKKGNQLDMEEARKKITYFKP